MVEGIFKSLCCDTGYCGAYCFGLGLVYLGGFMVIEGDMFGEKFLFESGFTRYYVGWLVVEVRSDSDVLLPPFTGKVVKSLLIRANPDLEKVFKSIYSPKPLSVSPLVLRGRVLWKRAGSSMVMKCRGGDRLGFHIGFREDVADMIIDAIHDLNDVVVFNARWRLLEASITSYELPSEDTGFDLDGKDMVIVSFRSPAILLDPYKAQPSNPRFLPLPGIVFSYNIGELLRMRSRDKRWDPRYWYLVDIVNAALHEHRRILDKIYTARYIYDGREGYGVGGHAVYYIVRRVLREKPWVKSFLENILLHATIMGVGTGRANGFGYVEIKLE